MVQTCLLVLNVLYTGEIDSQGIASSKLLVKYYHTRNQVCVEGKLYSTPCANMSYAVIASIADKMVVSYDNNDDNIASVLDDLTFTNI